MMNNKLFLALDIGHLAALFYFTYAKTSALFFFALGIPLGMLVTEQNPRKRLLLVHVALIPMLEFFSGFYAQYWFIFTFEGLVHFFIWKDLDPR